MSDHETSDPADVPAPDASPQPAPEPSGEAHDAPTGHDATSGGARPPGPPPGGPPPPTPPPRPGPAPDGGSWSRRPLRELRRRSQDRVLGGVASGLGDYFHVDPAIFRLVFVGLVFFGGTGFFLYLLGWVFLPARATGRSIAEDLLERVGGPRSAATWIFGGIVVVMVLNSTAAVAGRSIFGADLFWAIVLVTVGVLFFRRDDRPAGNRRDGAPATSATPAAQPPLGSVPARPPTTATMPTGAPPRPAPDPDDPLMDPLVDPLIGTELDPTIDDGWEPTPYVPSPPPPPPPSVLGRITVATALIVCGVLALVHTLTAVDISLGTYAAVSLVVVGAGLIIGARLGRSRGLIPLGLALIATLALSTAVQNIPLLEGFGERSWHPLTADDLQERYELGLGQMTLDLSELQLAPGERVEVAGRLGMGELEVRVPEDVTVEVDATGTGSVNVFDRHSDGTGVELSHVEDGPEGAPTILLDLGVGLGEIDVDGVTGPAAEPSTAPGVN